MSYPSLKYALHNGFIHDWLVAGPLALEVKDLERFTGPEYKMQIAEHYFQAGSGVTQTPVEKLPFEEESSGLIWEWVRCEDDHFVERTAFYHLTHYLRSWAFAQVEVKEAVQGVWTLTTNGPADVWVNGEHVHRQAHFYHQIPRSFSFVTGLKAGSNEILVRFEQVAARECPYAMALKIAAPDEAQILLPTSMEPLDSRQLLGEALFEAYLERDVFRHNDEITVCWPDDMSRKALVAVRLQTPDGRIYAEASIETSTAKPISVGPVHQYPNLQYDVMVIPSLRVYHEVGIRIRRKLPLNMFNVGYSTVPYGTVEQRRQEALAYAAEQTNNVFAEIAKMALNRWADVDTQVILEAIDGINQRQDCSDFYLVGLLGMMCRYVDTFMFPVPLKRPLRDCVLGFKYWDDEPGSDAMCYRTENHSILFHTAEILAGQLYPDEVFSNAGMTGRQHQEKGEQLALEWLHERGATGFTEWDSNCYFEEDLLALSHLVDLAESDVVYQLASVVMDKLFLTIALNSFKGVFGSTHGRTYSRHIKGAYRESTSPITRLMWGMGIWNDRILGLVSMACSEYELPLPIAAIALDQRDEMWNREQHPSVNKVTYKTPDFMLCSAQDWHPGQKGYQQHIWQATLSPDAVTFVTHPPCCSEEGSHRPNFWHGNVILPRVAQWKDVLIDVRNLPVDDAGQNMSGMGFTHAYFPTFAFDEWTLENGWAFARVGEGYLALTASAGIELAKRGANANRELRSYGRETVWACMLGRAAVDGTFDEFKQKVLALRVEFDGLSVSCDTLRGDTLRFGWEGDFIRNGEILSLSDFKHYENIFCTADYPCESIDIAYEDNLMRLHFGEIGG
ncbi:MAG: hypothetical protein JW934_10720 [Anaerolineae bacterium]|nr:hypothetical protein [Anaerolineae bacterium]